LVRFGAKQLGKAKAEVCAVDWKQWLLVTKVEIQISVGDDSMIPLVFIRIEFHSHIPVLSIFSWYAVEWFEIGG